MNAITALISNDLRLYFSSRRALLMNILAPILIAAFFGSMFDSDATKGPQRIPIAVVDLDHSDISTRILAAMKADTTFDIRELDEAAAQGLVKKGEVRASVVIPAGFGQQLLGAVFNPNAKPVIAVHYDPSQSMTLAVVNGLLVQYVLQGLAQSALSGSAGGTLLASARDQLTGNKTLDVELKRRLLAIVDAADNARAAAGPATRPATATATAAPTAGAPTEVPTAALSPAPSATPAGPGAAAAAQAATSGNASKAAPPPPGAAQPQAVRLQLPFTTRDEAVTSGADRKYNSYAHAFAGMSVQFILFMGIDLGVGLLMARRLGLWKRLRAAPLSRAALIGSRMGSGALIALILLLVIFAAAMAIFGVRIEGSIAGFIGVAMAFAVLTATFGLLIAALGKTPEATRGLAVFVTLLLVMLSGAWVPSFVFPEWLQTVSLFVPSRWAVDGLDGMTWRGLGPDAALAPIGVMLAFSAAFAGLALWRFDWEE